MSTTTQTPAAILGAVCDRPSCFAHLDYRPLRCPACGNSRLLYVEVKR